MKTTNYEFEETIDNLKKNVEDIKNRNNMTINSMKQSVELLNKSIHSGNNSNRESYKSRSRTKSKERFYMKPNNNNNNDSINYNNSKIYDNKYANGPTYLIRDEYDYNNNSSNFNESLINNNNTHNYNYKYNSNNNNFPQYTNTNLSNMTPYSNNLNRYQNGNTLNYDYSQYDNNMKYINKKNSVDVIKNDIYYLKETVDNLRKQNYHLHDELLRKTNRSKSPNNISQIPNLNQEEYYKYQQTKFNNEYDKEINNIVKDKNNNNSINDNKDNIIPNTNIKTNYNYENNTNNNPNPNPINKPIISNKASNKNLNFVENNTNTNTNNVDKSKYISNKNLQNIENNTNQRSPYKTGELNIKNIKLEKNSSTTNSKNTYSRDKSNNNNNNNNYSKHNRNNNNKSPLNNISDSELTQELKKLLGTESNEEILNQIKLINQKNKLKEEFIKKSVQTFNRVNCRDDGNIINTWKWFKDIIDESKDYNEIKNMIKLKYEIKESEMKDVITSAIYKVYRNSKKVGKIKKLLLTEPLSRSLSKSKEKFKEKYKY